MILKLLSVFWASLLLFGLMIALPALADNPVNGEQIFQVNCAGCHPKGGNIVRRGKNLQSRTLRRNHVDTLPAVIDLVTNGKNNMSAYQDRLSAEEIEAVSVYVLEQAANKWR